MIVIVYVDVHARNLVESPKKPQPEGPKRKTPTKVASWYLTGEKAMKYITDAIKRKEEKRVKEEKYDKARKEAVSKVKSEEQKMSKKVTRLTRSRMNLKPTKWVKHRQ